MRSSDWISDVFSSDLQVRFIKLGRGGAWASQAIADGTLPFGYRKIDPAPCAAGDWDAVRAQLVTEGRGATSVSQAMREIREYHEFGADCLWVTIADGHPIGRASCRERVCLYV